MKQTPSTKGPTDSATLVTKKSENPKIRLKLEKLVEELRTLIENTHTKKVSQSIQSETFSRIFEEKRITAHFQKMENSSSNTNDHS